jgi:hypothetical protein
MSTQVRWCDADTRGWISRDPGGFAMGDANLYRAMGNALTDGTDPTGLSTLTVGLGAGISVSDIQFAGSIEFNIQFNPSGWNWSVTATGSAPPQGGGLAIGGGPFVQWTSAASIDDLLGNSVVAGVAAGPGSIWGIVNKSLSNGYSGFGIGWSVKGFGANAYKGVATTVLIGGGSFPHRGPGSSVPSEEAQEDDPRTRVHEAPEPTYDDYNNAPINSAPIPKPPPADPWEDINNGF